MYKCLIPILVLFLSGCAFKPLPPKYFNNERLNDLKRVGIIIRIDSIHLMTDDKDGTYYEVYDYMPTSIYSKPFNSRYAQPLNFVYNKINSNSEIKIFYEKLLKEKGISIKELDYKPTPNTKAKCEPSLPFNLFDLVSHFSSDDEIDAILLVDVSYRLYIEEWLYSIIDIVKGAKCIITSRIIDLKNNTIIYERYSSWGEKKIKGKWNTPPEYENLTNSFKSALSDALEKERTYMNWQTKNKLNRSQEF